MRKAGNNGLSGKGLLLGGLMLLAVVGGYNYYHAKPSLGLILCDGIILVGGLFLGYRYAQGQLPSLPTVSPNSVDMVGIMQAQRHDFLNHLQVLGGLAQLKKTERVMEYISEAVQGLDRERVLTKYLPAEAGLVVLGQCQSLRAYGIPFNIELSVDLSRSVHGPSLAVLLTELFSLFLNRTRPEKMILRSCGTGSTGLEMILRGQGDLPVTALSRSRELARKMGSIIIVDQLEGVIRVRVEFLRPARGSGKSQMGRIDSSLVKEKVPASETDGLSST